VCSTN